MAKKKKQNETWDPVVALRRALHGQIISIDFFERHWKTTVLILAALMTYIASKYVCQTSMEEIRKLNKELEIVKAERIRVRSLYMGRTSESAISEMVDRVLPGLTVQEQPPYTLD